MAVTMAQSLTHSNLAPLDEDMEISSDAGRNVNADDIDIDIDIEDYRNDTLFDENMVDEGADERQQHVRNSPSRDDVMADEDGLQPTHYDGTMIDDFVIEDEELQDANINDLKDTEITEALDVHHNHPYVAEAADIAQIDDTDVTITAASDGPIIQNHSNLDVSAEPLILNTQPTSAEPNADKHDVLVETAPLESAPDSLETSHATEETATETHDQFNIRTEVAEDEKKDQQEEIAREEADEGHENEISNVSGKQDTLNEDEIEENWSVEDGDEGTGQVDDNSKGETASLAEGAHHNLKDSNNSATSVGSHPRHPVIVLYEGEEIYLIPPSNGDAEKSFFLSEPSLLDAPIQELLTACRDVLGENIDADSKLEIDIPDLHLGISEDTQDESSTCFSDVLEVYVSLCHNDGIETPDALYINLSAKPRFAPRLIELRQASEQGIGLSVMRAINESDSAEDAGGDISYSGESDAEDDSHEGPSQVEETHVAEPFNEEPEREPENVGDGAYEENSQAGSPSNLAKADLHHNEDEVAEATSAHVGASPYHTGTSGSVEGQEDELIDFGDPADDPDLADNDEASIGAEILHGELDSSKHGDADPGKDTTNVAGDDVFNEIQHEDFGEDEISYEDSGDPQRSLEDEFDDGKGQIADEEWYSFVDGGNEKEQEREEDGEEEREEENEKANDFEVGNEPETDTFADVLSTDLPNSESKRNSVSADVTAIENKTISRKRSREMAEFEHDNIEDGIEAKKVRPA